MHTGKKYVAQHWNRPQLIQHRIIEVCPGYSVLSVTFRFMLFLLGFRFCLFGIAYLSLFAGSASWLGGRGGGRLRRLSIAGNSAVHGVVICSSSLLLTHQPGVLGIQPGFYFDQHVPEAIRLFHGGAELLAGNDGHGLCLLQGLPGSLMGRSTIVPLTQHRSMNLVVLLLQKTHLYPTQPSCRNDE